MQHWFERAGLRVEREGEVFTTEIPIRWSDLDALGQVNNSTYFDYLQDARVDFLVDGGVTQMLEQGVLAVGHTITYREPMRWSSEPVQVHVVMLDRGAARFRVGYLVTHDEQVCAIAASTLVPYDIAAQRLRRITPEEGAHFDRFTWEVERPFRELPRPSLHGRGLVLPARTRWADIDTQHHVNNVRMLDYFQEARIVLAAAADPDALPWVIAQQEVEYVNQMRFRREPYRVTTAVTHLGRTSLTVASELVEPDSGTLISRSRMALVRVDEQGHPILIPDAVRSALGQYLLPAEG